MSFKIKFTAHQHQVRLEVADLETVCISSQMHRRHLQTMIMQAPAVVEEALLSLALCLTLYLVNNLLHISACSVRRCMVVPASGSSENCKIIYFLQILIISEFMSERFGFVLLVLL